jgi:hypothetical protein
MKIRRVIQKQIRHDKDGIQAAGDINAVVSINVNESTSGEQPVEQRACRAKPKDSAKRKPAR